LSGEKEAAWMKQFAVLMFVSASGVQIDYLH
jgi:hypothetical protein